MRAAVFPSTVGLTVLSGIALAFSFALAALLGGILAGAGLAALAQGLQIAARERAHRIRILAAQRAVYVQHGSPRASGAPTLRR
jgi:hypothetical protein